MHKGHIKPKLSVFKGRTRRLTKVIFWTLAHKGPSTIYDIYKEVRTRRGLRRTRYAGVNKRVRSLQETGYIKKIGARKTRAGFKAAIYELNAKAYLAILLDSIHLEDFVTQVDEATASAILAEITYAT